MKTPVALIVLLLVLASACASTTTNTTAGSSPEGGVTEASPVGPGPEESGTDDTGPTDPGSLSDGSAVIELTVTISHPDAPDAVYTITCGVGADEVSGDVELDAAAACQALRQSAAQTRLVEGVPADLICNQLYGGPDEAHIVGTYDGAEVDTAINRIDGCGIGDWDNLLSGVLPPARG